MTLTKINQDEIREIRDDIRKNVDKYDIKELNKKISEVSDILGELRQEKQEKLKHNKYLMKNLIIKK